MNVVYDVCGLLLFKGNFHMGVCVVLKCASTFGSKIRKKKQLIHLSQLESNHGLEVELIGV